MSKAEFFALQCSIFIVGSAAANHLASKVVFLLLGIGYLVMQIGAARNGE